MSDLKTERLINLTMALLASRRLLTKSEIFTSVAGYSGTQESMERMFERDKDDLRSLGIEIEVASIDPFFEDELGYRIRPEHYALEIPDFTPLELSLLSLAARSWRTETLTSSGQTALLKLESLGVDVDTQILSMSILATDNGAPDFDILWSAITETHAISFEYRAKKISQRNLHPYGLTLHKGEWYLAGFDLDKQAMRTFKLKRMTKVRKSGKPGAFEKVSDAELRRAFDFGNIDDRINTVLKVRKGKCFSLRTSAELLTESIEWDTISKDFTSLQTALFEILWAGSDVVVESPDELRAEVVAILKSHSAGGGING